jgi:hypothetical protein
LEVFGTMKHMTSDAREWTLNFSGHESFPLRYSWLSKGYQSICANAKFFGQDDSMVSLGVGKNMVSSIRHWGLACQAWEDVPGTRGKEIQPTRFGESILRDWDPYLQHPGTYWALHWMIVVNPHKSTTWETVFNRASARFGQDQLIQELVELAADRGDRKSSRASLKRDIEVFKRSYLRPALKKGLFQEDELDCPFKQLGLLRPTTTKGEYELIVGSRPSLPDAVFEWALLIYLEHHYQVDRHGTSIDDILYGLNSPGRVFRLSESALIDRLHELAENYPDKYLIDETVGLRQFVVLPSAPEPLDALASYYANLLEPTHA